MAGKKGRKSARDRTISRYQRLIAAVGLYGFSKLDLRNHTAFELSGVVPQKGKQISGLDEHADLLAGEEQEHGRRCGPLLFFSKPANTGLFVFTIADLLFSTLRKTRQKVYSYLESIGGPGCLESCTTPSTKSLLISKKRELIEGNSREWRAAALTIADKLKDDLLFNLAGLAQAAVAEFDEGTKSYLRRVLLPSSASLRSVLSAVPTREEAASAVKALAEQTGSLTQLCDQYYSVLGHLPFTDPACLANLVGGRLEQTPKAEESTWETIRQWVESKKSPFAMFHSALVFVRLPDRIPSAAVHDFWELVDTIVSSEHHSAREKTLWEAVVELARHFLCRMENTFPGENGERLAASAWWLADRCLAALDYDAVRVASLRDQWTPFVEYERSVWQIVHPSAGYSDLRYVTLYEPSLWSLGLLCEIGSRATELPPYSGDSERFCDELIAFMAHCYPLRIDRPPTYSFELHDGLCSAAWVQFFAEGSLRDKVQAFSNAYSTVTDIASFPALWPRFRQMKQADRFLLLLALRAMAYTGKFPGDLIRNDLIATPVDQTVLPDLDSVAAQLLIDAVRAVSATESEWGNELAHMLAHALTLPDTDQDRKRLLFDCALLLAAAAGMPSAIHHAEHSLDSAVRTDRADFWDSVIGPLLPTAAPWAAARLRAVKAALRSF